MGGRPPTPTALKKLHGNPGKRPLPEDEPMPRECKCPKAPAWLNKEAKAIFKSKVKELYEVGIVNQLDTEVLAIWADMMADYEDTSERMEKHHGIYEEQKIDFLGNEFKEPRRHPDAIKLDHLRKELRYYSTLLGTNPSARVKLKVIKVDENEFEDFLNKK